MLQAHLGDERPDEVTDLHRRASRWYDHNGQPAPAIRHAVAAGDIERAADLVELAIPELRRNRQEATIRGWLDAIPDEVVRMRPVLAVGLIGALMSGNEFEGIEVGVGARNEPTVQTGGRPRSIADPTAAHIRRATGRNVAAQARADVACHGQSTSTASTSSRCCWPQH
jgi:hypothetical protein